MLQRPDVERYRENRQDEIDSATEYSAMAESEPDPKIAKVYSNLARMEEAHVAFWGDLIALSRGDRRRTSTVLAQPRYRLDCPTPRPRRRPLDDCRQGGQRTGTYM